jgi:RNA polymerase sigma factor (sigma-70 family)
MSAHNSTPDVAIARVLTQLHAAFRNLLRRYRIPPADAEDLVQDVVLEALLHWPEIRHPEPWLLGALRFKCLGYWRHAKASPLDGMESEALEQLAEPLPLAQEQRGLHRDVHRCLATLPCRHQAVLWLRYGLGYSVPEVAATLGYTPANVKKIAGRAIARLRGDDDDAPAASREALRQLFPHRALPTLALVGAPNRRSLPVPHDTPEPAS